MKNGRERGGEEGKGGEGGLWGVPLRAAEPVAHEGGLGGLVLHQHVLQGAEAHVASHLGERGELAAPLHLHLGGDSQRVRGQVLPRQGAAEEAHLVRGARAAQRAPLVARAPDEVGLEEGAGEGLGGGGGRRGGGGGGGRGGA